MTVIALLFILAIVNQPKGGKAIFDQLQYIAKYLNVTNICHWQIPARYPSSWVSKSVVRSRDAEMNSA
ncbi:MAG: hypothetical protein KKG99_13610 [Bacteroidetes bacterium]|nr:hypothetical protein [Bacteroidota bacterium]